MATCHLGAFQRRGRHMENAMSEALASPPLTWKVSRTSSRAEDQTCEPFAGETEAIVSLSPWWPRAAHTICVSARSASICAGRPG